jgi:hypothetical protein
MLAYIALCWVIMESKPDFSKAGESVVRLTAPIFSMILITGCATTEEAKRPAGPPPASTRPVYNLTGYSPAFKDGYIDGCETSKKTRYGAKDERRFSADAQYKMGWNDGYSVCRAKR